MADEIEFGVEQEDFSSMSVDFKDILDLVRSGYGGDLTARFDRIREVVLIEDIIAELHPRGAGSNKFSCPFHGRDSTPSFYVYRANNSAYCYGCPEGSKYYTAVEFVAAKYGYTKMQALQWLEKKYNLPPLANEEEQLDETDIGGGLVEVRKVLTFEDLREAFIKQAQNDLRQTRNPELFFQYNSVFSNAIPQTGTDPETDVAKVLSLARLLDPDVLDDIRGNLEHDS